MSEHIKINVNGKAQLVPENTTIAQLLAQLKLSEQRIAVERNAVIIASAMHAQTQLNENDCLEIIHAVGGG